MHVDEFIDNPIPLQKFKSDEEREGVRYAKFVLSLLRLNAALRIDVERFIPKLYCTWRGERYEVTHASHHGYVGITKGFGSGAVTDCAMPLECSDWGAKP